MTDAEEVYDRHPYTAADEVEYDDMRARVVAISNNAVITLLQRCTILEALDDYQRRRDAGSFAALVAVAQKIELEIEAQEAAQGIQRRRG